MYFKRLELIGFKSFCDKTRLDFEPGVTAVVGPNGCGKSNVFDSIRWVLGEQSAKSLRGSDMQDVIFNGTDTKDALGMAEVSLTFDNSNQFFSVDNPEVMITRRLFRSGESEYLINKTPARLKDIMDLLLGTGIGAESYSIVAQGKIDMLLSSRPEDRRMVFDEASGITKYKAQKRETLRRLEDTEQNLLRVNDIITEVKRQISSLERQANKARKYKEVFEALKNKETSLAIIEKEKISLQKDEIALELAQLKNQESDLALVLREEEAKVSIRQDELRNLENQMMAIKNQILGLENSLVRNQEHIAFNQKRIEELDENKKYLEAQIMQLGEKLISDEEKLNKVREEYSGIKNQIDEKTTLLNDKEAYLATLVLSIKLSLDKIAESKKSILDLVARIAAAKNEIADLASKQQVFSARSKRLDIEKAKVYEEKSIAEESLKSITTEVNTVKTAVEESVGKIGCVKENLQVQDTELKNITVGIIELEKQILGLQSHKEFLEKLKTKYDDIGECMNAVIYLDKLPTETLSGLVIKIKDHVSLSDEDRAYLQPANFKLSGEAKPIELDTLKIEEKINILNQNVELRKNQKSAKEAAIEELRKGIVILEQELRNQEILLANKETSRQTIAEQFDKIKEEEDVIGLEIQDLQRELVVVEQNNALAQTRLCELNKEHMEAESRIVQEEHSISHNSKVREEAVVVITKVKTELDAFTKRLVSDEVTLKILESSFNQDRDSLLNVEKQIQDCDAKKTGLFDEIRECEERIIQDTKNIEDQKGLLCASEEKYRKISEDAAAALKKMEEDRVSLDEIKNKLYRLQMQEKDVEYKLSRIKERMLAAYKFDLEAAGALLEPVDSQLLSQEIERLKEKVDSYGSVNLVAIEEYDELKKRYDFLLQQQTDLTSAKDALHQAMLKINRTTKEMFLDTFEKVKVEFRNYFRLLFNGGDAQVFLVDEQDPLESGIEIICRPPGKKLQNVLLLSGGEKTMSAIALIFAIFKVKPSPFCILDEIDAALDEANVDRFARILQEFSVQSQFIVITHNKRTIANADVMYGITMEQSGISKIVSVKFANRAAAEKKSEPETVAA